MTMHSTARGRHYQLALALRLGLELPELLPVRGVAPGLLDIDALSAVLAALDVPSLRLVKACDTRICAISRTILLGPQFATRPLNQSNVVERWHARRGISAS